jgi:peptide/nickel transport system substrate-binding protein
MIGGASKKGEKRMNKLIPIALILGLLLGVSAILAPPIFASPPISRPMDLYDITIQGDSPVTVDYSWCYDTASGEILQNTMDTLLMWNGESSTTPYIYAIAISETDGPVTNGQSSIGAPNPPTSDSISGLNFENTAQGNGTNFAQYYWQYDFKIRQGVEFQPPYNYSLTPEDVAYSFQRTILQDRVSGPQWMLQEPLLDQAAGLNVATTGGLADFTNNTQLAEVGALVRDAVQFNATDVWFNIMFPGPYAPFLEILCQTWSSIESKQWINNQVITAQGRPDWPGFSFNSVYGLGNTNLTGWVPYWNPAHSPLDYPTPIEYGSGPFILTPGTPDYTTNYWGATRNPNWWGGAPCFYPTEAGAQPAGYANTIEVSWNYPWSAAQAYFKSGACDFVALPSLANIGDLYQIGYNSPYPYPDNSTNLPDAGIRCYADLPELEVDALFFTMNISSATPYGTIDPPVSGTGAASFNPNGIPSNFFGNEPFNNPYGIDMRKAFAYSIDYATELQVAALGEGFTPATAIIPGLYGYNASITGYNYNLTMATQYFNDWPGLMNNGFTITLVYNTGDGERQELYDLIQTAVQSINPLFKVNVISLDWGTYLTAADSQELSTYVLGWLADFPDPHDFALPFYHTGGDFSSLQLYSNATMDNLINMAIALPDGPQRLQLYSEIQQLAIGDCPSVPIFQPLDRYFEYDWVNGWYYNPIYPGLNFFNMYKFYYPPESNQPTQSQPFSEYLPADVNRDGTVNMKDIASIARAFGASWTEPIPANWQFTDDLVNIRTINMKSIAFVARQFGAVSPIGTFGPLVTINPITSTISAGDNITFTATCASGYGNVNDRVIQWYYGTLTNGQLGAPTAGPSTVNAATSTFTWSSIPAGASYVFCTVTDTFTGSIATARASAGLSNTAIAYSEWAGIYAS